MNKPGIIQDRKRDINTKLLLSLETIIPVAGITLLSPITNKPRLRRQLFQGCLCWVRQDEPLRPAASCNPLNPTHGSQPLQPASPPRPPPGSQSAGPAATASLPAGSQPLGQATPGSQNRGRHMHAGARLRPWARGGAGRSGAGRGAAQPLRGDLPRPSREVNQPRPLCRRRHVPSRLNPA